VHFQLVHPSIVRCLEVSFDAGTAHTLDPEPHTLNPIPQTQPQSTPFSPLHSAPSPLHPTPSTMYSTRSERGGESCGTCWARRSPRRERSMRSGGGSLNPKPFNP